MPKKVIISVITDLVTDQRVHRSAATLAEEGWDVLVIGRELPESNEVPVRNYKVKRFRLWFHKGPPFYAAYNIALFFYLLFRKADVLYSNDLDTLPANMLVARLRGLPVIYDSHEYFTGVPELMNRPDVQKIWKSIERRAIPHVRQMITVNESIARLYETEYGRKVHVIRNVPDYHEAHIDKTALRKKLGLQERAVIYILQGSGINIDRGAEEAVDAMQYIANSLLVIAGSGDVFHLLKKKAEDPLLKEKIRIIDRLPYEELKLYTRAADVGLTLDKDTNINYRFSLPNKLFDYMHAGLAVLCTDLPEVAGIVKKYNTGMVATGHDPEKLALAMKDIVNDPVRLQEFQRNSVNASKELCWQHEKQTLISIFKSLD